MSGEQRSNPPGSASREEAANWFVRMRGPDAYEARPDFEVWLASNALHRDAYNRITEVFSLGKGLNDRPADAGRFMGWG
jgi:transmembrane sensor